MDGDTWGQIVNIATQVPGLVVLCYLVHLFLKHLKDERAFLQELSDNHKESSEKVIAAMNKCVVQLSRTEVLLDRMGADK